MGVRCLLSPHPQYLRGGSRERSRHPIATSSWTVAVVGERRPVAMATLIGTFYWLEGERRRSGTWGRVGGGSPPHDPNDPCSVVEVCRGSLAYKDKPNLFKLQSLFYSSKSWPSGIGLPMVLNF